MAADEFHPLPIQCERGRDLYRQLFKVVCQVSLILCVRRLSDREWASPSMRCRNRSLPLQSTSTLVLAKPSSSQSNSAVDALNFCGPIPILRDIFRINGLTIRFDDF